MLPTDAEGLPSCYLWIMSEIKNWKHVIAMHGLHYMLEISHDFPTQLMKIPLD